MMERLIARAEKVGRAAQASRLKEIAAELGASGVSVESDGETVTFRGRALASRWLSDPILRFAVARAS